MNIPLIVAGSLVVLGAAIHGGAGEFIVVRRLAADALPPTRFGGSRMTQAMIHVTWHMTTIAFLTVGIGLVVSGSMLHGDARRAIGFMSAAACTGFAVLTLTLGGGRARAPRSLVRHPAPLLLTSAASLAWWGTL